MFPKIVTKIVYIRKTYKAFSFSYELAKNFSVINYKFILFRFHRTLIPIRNKFYMLSVNAIRKNFETFMDSSRIRKSLHECDRSINEVVLVFLLLTLNIFYTFF